MAHSQNVAMKAPELHKTNPARRPCVTDVLCNWFLFPQKYECVCNCLDPIAFLKVPKRHPPKGPPPNFEFLLELYWNYCLNVTRIFISCLNLHFLLVPFGSVPFGFL